MFVYGWVWSIMMLWEDMLVVNECGLFLGWGLRKRKCYVGFYMRLLERWIEFSLIYWLSIKFKGKECWVVEILLDREMGIVYIGK